MVEVWCCRVAHLCLHVAAVLHGRGRGDRRPARLAAHAHLQEIPHHLFAIEFGTDLDGTQDFFQLFWPIVLSHRIDESSPLWSVSPEDLMTEQFEIILVSDCQRYSPAGRKRGDCYSLYKLLSLVEMSLVSYRSDDGGNDAGDGEQHPGANILPAQ